MARIHPWNLAAIAIATGVLFLAGCPTAADDDAGDDDDLADDDDDLTDDDAGDDDTHPQTMIGYTHTSEPGGFVHEQALAGTAAATPCPGCEYTFEIHYSTTDLVGTCSECWDFADGVYTLGYDSDFNGYQAIVYAGYYWYAAYAGYQGHQIFFYYQTGYATSTQYGFWDW